MAGEHVSEFAGVKKGAWAPEEDDLLRDCINKYGEKKWHLVPERADLRRCPKSCRVRWLNYLKPNIKRGKFEDDEVDLILRLHHLLGNRWSLIAGRIPGRTANDIKNYWNACLSKKIARIKSEADLVDRKVMTTIPNSENRYADPKQCCNCGLISSFSSRVIKPQPRRLSKMSNCLLRFNTSYETRSTWGGAKHHVSETFGGGQLPVVEEFARRRYTSRTGSRSAG